MGCEPVVDELRMWLLEALTLALLASLSRDVDAQLTERLARVARREEGFTRHSLRATVASFGGARRIHA